MPANMLPIIHPGSFELSIIHFETERFDEMERGGGRGAETGNVPRVGRDFGFEEDDVHGAE